MKRISAINGYALGDARFGYIDLVVLPDPETKHVREMPFHNIVQSLIEAGGWRRASPGNPLLGKTFSNYTGCVCVSSVYHTAGRFLLPPKQNLLDALYELEEYEHKQGFTLPLPLVLGWLAFDAAGITNDGTITTVPTDWMASVDYASVPCSGFGRLPMRELRELVREFVTSDGDYVAVRRPASPVDMARYLLLCGKTLWDGEVMQSLAVEQIMAPSFVQVARNWSKLVGGARFTYQGEQFRAASNLEITQDWSETAAVLGAGMPSSVLKYFCAIPRDDDSTRIIIRDGPVLVDDVDHDLRRGICVGLLRDAQANRVYTASGEFTLLLPEHYPLRKVGIHAIMVSAQPDHLFFAVLDHRGYRSPVFAWRPNEEDYNEHDENVSQLYMTMCALWHDLLVAGETVFVQTNGRSASKPAPRSISKQHGKRARVLNLPRKRTVYLTGKRQWGTEQDRAAQRAAHGVGMHLRKLAEGWQRSSQAEVNAAEFGVVLPDQYTFVKPYIKGRGEVDESQPVETYAKARGLNTVMVFLR